MVLMMNPNFKGQEIQFDNVKNINNFLLKNYSNIKNIKRHYKSCREKIRDALKKVEMSEKDRMINNYSLLLAFAKAFGIDGIEEVIVSQIIMQV